MLGLGALTTGVIATVDERGTVRRSDAALSWRVRAGDRWIDAVTDPSVRSARLGPAPIGETAVRVPGGDVLARAYALSDDGGIVVVEVENASPEAVAVAFALTGADVERALAMPRRPGAVEPDGAVVFPVPHRVMVRVALAPPSCDVRTLPDWASVQRGWERVLDRGMRTELPEPVQTEIDAARADVLLASPSAAAFVALEAWGFDEEAVSMWDHLTMRARRAARKRRGLEPLLLNDMRNALIRDYDDDIDILPGFRSEWLGQHLAVHDAPLWRGACSFALRWHGARPALLWDAPPDCRVKAPVLDATWSSREQAGETLLAEPSGALLAMGTRATEGASVDAPESFS
ncbi:MAG TPA: hypothetical protein VL856_01295 [Acidimicrobiia bacterium]|jgi:hypothetical protein|nr:hypothetical protein [Acidimicrobiia bacterium]